VIARDRSGAYADGAQAGAPDAEQVADRFHLVQNAGAALDELLRGRRRLLDRALQAAAEAAQPPPLDGQPEPLAARRPPGPSARHEAARRAARVARWERAHALRAEGRGIRAIARELGIHRRTVKGLLASPLPPRNRSAHPRPEPLASPTLQPHVEYLRDRWQAGCRNLSQLFRELLIPV